MEAYEEFKEVPIEELRHAVEYYNKQKKRCLNYYQKNRDVINQKRRERRLKV